MDQRPLSPRRPGIEYYKPPDRSHTTYLGRKFICNYPSCGDKVFYQLRSYDIHCELCHTCNSCGKCFDNATEHYEICKNVQHGAGNPQQNTVLNLTDLDRGMFKEIRTYHKKTIAVFEVNLKTIVLGSFADVFEYIFSDFEKLIKSMLILYKGVKVSLLLSTVLEDMKGTDKEDRDFFSPYIAYTHPSFIENNLLTSAAYLIKSLNLLTEKGSGWKLKEIVKLTVTTAQYLPIRPRGRNQRTLKVPRELCRGTIININTNTDCFVLSVVCALYRNLIKLPEHPLSVYDDLDSNAKKRLKRKFEDPDQYKKILYWIINQELLEIKAYMGKPMPLELIEEFENANNNKLTISVFTSLGKNLIPIRLPKHYASQHANLLLLTDAHPKNPSFHYCVIADTSQFLGKAGFRKQLGYCNICLKPYTWRTEDHQKFCGTDTPTKAVFPKDKYLTFRKLYMLQDLAFKAFFFINCFRSSPSESKEKFLSEFIAASYSIVVLGPKGTLVYSRFYDGLDVMVDFVNTVQQISELVDKYIAQTFVPLVHTTEDMELKQTVQSCEFCRKEVTADGQIKLVLHHSHLNECAKKIWICNSCNLQIKQRSLVFVTHRRDEFQHTFFTLLKALSRDQAKNAHILTKNIETIISLVFKRCRFIDSNLFIDSPMQNLIERLAINPKQGEMSKAFPTMHSMFSSSGRWEGLLNEMHFPFMSYNSSSKYKNQFPPRSEFKNEITGEIIAQSEYNRIHDISIEFDAHSLKVYNELYLTRNVCALADIFMQFVEFCVVNFKISPLHSCSLPSFAYDAFVFELEDKVENIQAFEVWNFINEGCRAGPSVSTTRKATSNSERTENFNGVDAERKEIVFMDYSSMYPFNLRHYLGCGNYKFMSKSELDGIDFLSLPEDSGVGWIFQVSLSYSPALHDRDNLFPLALSKRKFNFDYISTRQKLQYEKLGLTFPDDTRLSMDLFDKPYYTCYYKVLKYFLSRGLEIKERHIGLTFSETPYMRKHVDKCLDLRKTAKLANDSIGELIMKAWLCSLYGKLLSSSKNYYSSEIVTTRTEALTFIAKPTFQNLFPIGEDVSLFLMSRSTVHYPYNNIAPFICLDMAKRCLYEGYDMMREKFSHCKLILAETDSLCLEIGDPDRTFETKMSSISSRFDLSNLSSSDPLYNAENKGCPGVWKLCYPYISEVISVAPKNYSVLLFCKCCKSNSEIMCTCSVQKAARVDAASIKRINHEFYRHLLDEDEKVYTNARAYQSNLFHCGVKSTRKLSWHCFNISRYLNKNGIDSTAFGHWRLLEGQDL